MASKVDTSDPNVRRAVYNMYRGILGNYNQKANNIVNTLPRHRVTQDQGIDQQIQSMIRQSNQMSGGGANNPSSPGPPLGAAPPPPPPYATGAVPSVRIPTEVGYRKEPPAAIQNAMMTKDKKPFTYTPGGLDLAEIRSPRMAKRISRNAHLEDSCTGAAAAAAAAGPVVHPHQLPPQTLAAMQPQIAVAVLPQGATLPKPLNSPPTPGGMNVHAQNYGGFTPPSPVPSSGALPSPPVPSSGAPLSPPIPSSFAPPPPSIPNSVGPAAMPYCDAYPPPPPPMMPTCGAPPPPPMPAGGGPPPPPPLPGNGPPPKPTSGVTSPPGTASPSDTLRRNQPRPDYIADIANHAHTLKRVNHPPRSQADLQSQAFPQIQLRQTGFHPKMQNDENEPDNEETSKPGSPELKAPSPPRSVQNGITPPITPLKEQPKNQVKAVSPVLQAPVARPNFQQPLQQTPSSRPQFRPQQSPSPSPPVGNQQGVYRPQMSPVTPERFVQPTPAQTPPPRPQFQPQPTPPLNNQPMMYRPQMSPVTPDLFIPMKLGQSRDSPEREIVTVFQPQVFQDISQPQNERYQGASPAQGRPPGLKMPEEVVRGPTSSPAGTLRQAPAPWMSPQRSMSKELPPWAREDATPPVQANSRPTPPQLPENYEALHQQIQQHQEATSSQQSRVRIIPIRLEGSDDVIQPQTPPQARNKYDQTDGGQYQQLPPAQQYQQQPQMYQQPQGPRGWSQVTSPPVQSRSFRVLQKITGSEQEGIKPSA